MSYRCYFLDFYICTVAIIMLAFWKYVCGEHGILFPIPATLYKTEITLK